MRWKQDWLIHGTRELTGRVSEQLKKPKGKLQIQVSGKTVLLVWEMKRIRENTLEVEISMTAIS